MPQSWPLAAQPYPDANEVLKSLLRPIAPTALRVPTDFTPPLIIVQRVGGQPDAEDITDYPIMLIAVYGKDYPAASALMGAVQVRILTSPLTAVSYSTVDLAGNPVEHTVCIDVAGVHVGEAELPDVHPDDRRITATYQLGWRRTYPH